MTVWWKPRSLFIRIEKRQGMKVACLEEVAYRKGWLNVERVTEQIEKLSKTYYGRYLQMLIGEKT